MTTPSNRSKITLGRWGVFGALAGLPLSPERLQFAVVLLAAGYCIEGYYIVNEQANYLWVIDEQVKERMMSILGDHFGLSRDEQELYLRNFPANVSPGGVSIVLDPISGSSTFVIDRGFGQGKVFMDSIPDE